MLSFFEFLTNISDKKVKFSSEEIKEFSEETRDFLLKVGTSCTDEKSVILTIGTLLSPAKEIISSAEESLYEMANLIPKKTGLPFVVWVSPKGGARHDVRIKVSQNAKAIPTDMISVAIRPSVKVIDGDIKGKELNALKKWIALNKEIIIQYWDGTIEDTEIVYKEIKKI